MGQKEKGKRKECRHCVLPNFFLLPFPLAFSMADLAAHPAFLATDFPSSRAATSATHSQASKTRNDPTTPAEN
jgi:hypothetical protein